MLAIGYLLLAIFVVVLAVCWIILPFALIGTKPVWSKYSSRLSSRHSGRLSVVVA
jgi:hypothetical protein